MYRFVLILMMVIPLGAFAQGNVTVGGMKMGYLIEDDSIEFTLFGPTKGWVGIGFNSTNSIAKSDLILLTVQGSRAKHLDMYVRGVGNPLEDVRLGGSNDVIIQDFSEDEEGTTITFKMPLPSKDNYDYAHQLGESFWLIMAYSVSDDFGHHSHMRKHIPFKLEKN